MTYTRADWSDALLTAIGNQHSTDYVRHWIESWTQWETTHPPGAAFNLLNTTESWKPDGTAYHATDFNSVELLHALVNNDEAALKSPNASIQAEINLWGTHHAIEIAALASDLANLRFAEPFPGDATPALAPPPQVQPPQQGGSVIELGGFPFKNQLTDGDPNSGLDCVPTSLAAGMQWLLGKPVDDAAMKDAVYGRNYIGGTAASAYVNYAKAHGIHLFPMDEKDGTKLVQDVINQLKAGHPVAATEPYSPKWTHVVCFYKYDEATQRLSVMDPLGGHEVTRSVHEWSQLLLYNEVWGMEKIALLTLSDALAKAGWVDDGTTLHAPAPHNTIPITGVFRLHVLARSNPPWRVDDYPLALAQSIAPLEGSNPALGNGVQQAFRFQYLETKVNDTHVIEVSTGQELYWLRGKYNDLLTIHNELIAAVQQQQQSKVIA